MPLLLSMIILAAVQIVMRNFFLPALLMIISLAIWAGWVIRSRVIVKSVFSKKEAIDSILDAA